jgi:quercetin dioxygenase-like cupin family protein
MSFSSMDDRCGQTDVLYAYALHALPEDEQPRFEVHLAECAACQGELEALRPTVDSFVHWPTDVLRPSPSVWARVAKRVADETGGEPVPSARTWSEPDGDEVAPGIFCKILSHDGTSDRVSMLVRLAPGVSYPPHTHAGVEELHLLEGELWIDEKKLYPGDYNYGAPGDSDQRVWSETGCTCVLVTSSRDILR